MKGLKLSLVILTATLLTIGLGGVAYAFHDGGVAECGGCHSMHGVTTTAGKTSNTFLLIASDDSSVCLGCHEATGLSGPSSYHVSTPGSELSAGISPKQRTPGGDFAWLKKTYSWASGTSTTSELGQTHGHNIISVDKGYTVDTTNTNAPGGTFPASQLGCQSCHDPHGRGRQLSDGTFMVPGVGVSGAPILGSGSYANQGLPGTGLAIGLYRILAYPGYTRASGVTWGGWPIAVAPSTYNQTEASTQVRVAYGSSGSNTWGRWCGSCHPDMAGTSNGGSLAHVHPVDAALGTGSVPPSTIYNAYVKSGDMSGAAATSFTSLVPFAENTADRVTLASHAGNTNVYLNGPGTSDQVTCFTCHRAHASAFPNALRWNGEYEMLTINGQYPGTNSTPTPNVRASRGRVIADYQAGYYDRPATVFATYQRSLCNKCHAND
jgi:hypothetical protein